MGHNGGWDRLVAVVVFVAFIGMSHGDTLLVSFVGAQQVEDIFIMTKQKNPM